MTLEELNEKVKQLELRVRALEALPHPVSEGAPSIVTKKVTLAELARKELMRKANGQQKVAAIVGYFELILKEGSSKNEKIKEGWNKGKFAGKYNPIFVSRALGDLIRDPSGKGAYDLTQKGEDFFKTIVE